MTREQFSMAFSMDNAAFEKMPATEVARILREVARKVEEGRTDGLVCDTNGNRIGSWRMGP